MASTIHEVLFPFDIFFFALLIFVLVRCVVLLFDLQWTGVVSKIPASYSHIALISLYPTHWRQTALSVGVAGRMFMIAFLFIHFDFLSLFPLTFNGETEWNEKKKTIRFVIYHKFCWRRKIVQLKIIKPIWKSIKNTRSIIAYTTNTHHRVFFLFTGILSYMQWYSIESIHLIFDAFCRQCTLGMRVSMLSCRTWTIDKSFKR